MKSIQVQDGDIVLNTGQLAFVQGQNKLIQGLTLWLKEPMYGNPPQGPGFTSPLFGSFLESYIGQSNSSLMETQVKSEILRILGLYQQSQIFNLQQAQHLSALAYWSRAEIIEKIVSVNISSNTTAINAAVVLQTLANDTIELNIFIGQNGITVV